MDTSITSQITGHCMTGRRADRADATLISDRSYWWAVKWSLQFRQKGILKLFCCLCRSVYTTILTFNCIHSYAVRTECQCSAEHRKACLWAPQLCCSSSAQLSQSQLRVTTGAIVIDIHSHWPTLTITHNIDNTDWRSGHSCFNGQVSASPLHLLHALHSFNTTLQASQCIEEDEEWVEVRSGLFAFTRNRCQRFGQ